MIGLRELARKARLAVGLALIKRSYDAPGIQRLQLSLLKGEVREEVNRYQDYGFSSHARAGASAVAVAVGGSRNHLAILVADDARYRKRDLAEGEVAIYHWEGDYILFRNGREIEVVAGARVRVTAPEVIIAANTRVQLETPTVEMTGDLSVAGNVTVQGTVEGSDVRTQSGISLGTHRHPGVMSGSAITGGPQ